MTQTTRTGVSSLLDEASLIVDPDVRSFTQVVVCASAEDNWRKRSGWNHHLEDERGEWGNYIHTIRVLRIVGVLADLLDLPQMDKDVLRSSAILHDSCKHDVYGDSERLQTKQHACLVAELVQESGVAYHPAVKACIEQHMGRWGSVPCDWASGKITLSFLLHVADCIESNLPEVMDVVAPNR